MRRHEWMQGWVLPPADRSHLMEDYAPDRRCPSCQSPMTHAESVRLAPGPNGEMEAVQVRQCLSCHTTWEDIYQFQGHRMRR